MFSRSRATSSRALAAEFPGLELRWTSLTTHGGPSPPELRARLRELADRGRGARVLTMRTQPIAHAYRAFYRHTGLDPDVTRIPSEQAALARLVEGGFRSRGLIPDALLVALVETGVPVWALRARTTQPESLTIRLSRSDEPLGEGRLVIADARRVHGPLSVPRTRRSPHGGAMAISCSCRSGSTVCR